MTVKEEKTKTEKEELKEVYDDMVDLIPEQLDLSDILIKVGKELIDYWISKVPKGSTATKKAFVPNKDPSKSDYTITFLKNSDSGKAKLINYKNVEMWIPNGCIKSDLIETENTEQKATIQDWILATKLKEVNNIKK